jgi:hypothetical protein
MRIVLFTKPNLIYLAMETLSRYLRKTGIALKRVPGSAKEKDLFTKVTNSKRILHQHYK